MTNAEAFYDKGTASTIFSIFPQISNEDLWFTSRIGLHRKTSTHHVDTFSMGLKNEKYEHFFLNGYVRNGEIFFSDYKDGVVRFNTKTKAFVKYHIGNTEWSRAKSIVHIEDDLFLVNAEIKGMAIFDASSGMYQWLESNRIIQKVYTPYLKTQQGFMVRFKRSII